MGGPGSGRLFRWDRQGSLEECQAIDVRVWARQGFLREGTRFSWSWTCGGQPSGDIQVWGGPGSVLLIYRTRSGGEDWRDVRDQVRVRATPCQFGGERHWFICPYCAKRAAKLFLTAGHFRCRRCARKPYASQQETVLDRALRRARKLRAKLGDDGHAGDPVFRKPKGMHWATFERIRAQIEAQDEIAEGALVLGAMRILGRARR